jgi:hypothetical protein
MAKGGAAFKNAALDSSTAGPRRGIARYGHLRPYAASPATGCRAQTPDLSRARSRTRTSDPDPTFKFATADNRLYGRPTFGDGQAAVATAWGEAQRAQRFIPCFPLFPP